MVERATADFGPRMKRAREDRGVTLRHIADTTKISVSALEALERNDISRLPGGIFSRAFIRSYALEIGLDPEQAVRDFLGEFPENAQAAASGHSGLDAAGGAARKGVAAIVVVIAVAALLIVAFLVIYR